MHILGDAGSMRRYTGLVKVMSHNILRVWTYNLALDVYRQNKQEDYIVHVE